MLRKSVQGATPAARHHEWCGFAERWAQLNTTYYDAAVQGGDLLVPALPETLEFDLAARFSAWLQLRYGGLHTQPPFPSVMVYQVPKALPPHREQADGRRLALIVMDRVAVDQWQTVKWVLGQQTSPHQFRESVLFAWMSTPTTVSRQGIFSGRTPAALPKLHHVHWREMPPSGAIFGTTRASMQRRQSTSRGWVIWEV